MLDTYRQEIDKLDKEILKLLGQRFLVVKKVGEYKKKNNIKPLQKGRWDIVLSNAVNIGKTYGLNEEFVKDIWNRIHDEALKIESK